VRRRGFRTRAITLTGVEWLDWTLLASLFAAAHALLAVYAR
jgi:hypothetical protein